MKFICILKRNRIFPSKKYSQTPDLFEARNIPQVTLCLYALARTTQKHSEYDGPRMGPKMATENKVGTTLNVHDTKSSAKKSLGGDTKSHVNSFETTIQIG